MAKITDRDLSAMLAAENADALGAKSASGSSTLSSEREDALSYYMGEMDDMPSVEGRSKAVSTDVFDTIESMLPDLVEVFTGGEEVVRFKPVGPEDVQAAEQETQYVNHVFMEKNDGFLVLYSFFKDALLSKNGVAKVYWDETEEDEQQTFLDQPEDVFALVSTKPDVEITEHSEHQDDYGQTLHDFTVRTKKSYGCCKVEPVPPEEFGVARDTRTLRKARYCFHRVKRYQADLIAEGYDPEQIRKLPTYGENQSSEESARDTVDEGAFSGGDSGLNTAMRPIDITEHYIRMDYDGKGARLYRVTTGGDSFQVLRHKEQPAVVPINRIPFAAITPIIVTHRWQGRSVADLVMEIQRIKTALLRALLDNAYLAVNPITEVSEENASATTIDDLLVRRPGGLVRSKRPGGVQIIEHPGVGDDVFPLMEYQDSVREWRTGVTRQGAGLDADALNNQSATAANQLHNAAKAKLKLIARIFAETGVKDLFWIMHATIRENASQQDTFQVSNNWITVDPRTWKTRNDMTADVGLGTGSKQEQLVGHQMVMNVQKELMLAGLTNMVSPQNLWNSCKKLVRLLGEKAADQYFTDPSTQPPPEPKPDPEMVKIQGQLEIEKIQAQADIANTEKKLQADLTKISAEIQMSRELHGLKMEELRETNAIKMQQMRMKTVSDAMKPQPKGEAGEGGGEGHPMGNGHDHSAVLVSQLMEQLSAMNKPKRMRKLADGSWVSEPVH